MIYKMNFKLILTNREKGILFRVVYKELDLDYF